MGKTQGDRRDGKGTIVRAESLRVARIEAATGLKINERNERLIFSDEDDDHEV